MQSYEVGKPFQEGTPSFQQGCKFGFGQAGGDMLITLARPTEQEIESIKSGKMQLGLYFKDGIIFILVKFEGMEWMDMPYNVHLSSPFEFQELADGMGYSCTIFLVDAATGILKVLRYVGLPTDFSKSFRTSVLFQKELPFSRQVYDRKINEIYENYTTKNLLYRADIYKIGESK